MGKARLEAFSDGVIAIMVLELTFLHAFNFRVLLPLWPVFMSDVLSVVYFDTYWNKPYYACHLSTVRYCCEKHQPQFSGRLC